MFSLNGQEETKSIRGQAIPMGKKETDYNEGVILEIRASLKPAPTHGSKVLRMPAKSTAE
jgi:hypothetical protein